MKLALSFFLSAFLALCQTAPLTNADVIEMTHAGLSPAVIEAKITSSGCRFDTTTGALSQLKAAGVNDEVVAAMIRCAPAAAPHAKPYVWIGANEEWTTRGIGAASANRFGNTAVVTGATRSITESHSEFADIARELSDRCPSVQITNTPSNADFAITVDRHNAGHLLSQRNSYNIFRASDGALLQSGKTVHLKNAVSDICRAISPGAR